MPKIDINSDQWCNMVFEDRNTEFGAFVLRTESSKRHMKALIIASVAFLLAITGPILIKQVFKKKDAGNTLVTVIDAGADTKKPKDDVKPPEIPPEEQKLIQSTVAFAPVIDPKAPDDSVPTQQQLLQNNVAISNVTVQGNTTDVNAEIPTAPVVTDDPNAGTIYDVVSKDPQFPGGQDALAEFIKKKLIYPQSAIDNNIQGKVILRFVVGKDGRISSIEVLRSLDPACDEEAVRVVKSMPSWSPGEQGDVKARVRMSLTIGFTLASGE